VNCPSMMERDFGRLAGRAAIGAAATGFLYSISFVVIARSNANLGLELTGLFLLCGGLLSTAVFTELFQLTRDGAGGFAMWFLLLGTLGAFSAMAHGTFDL